MSNTPLYDLIKHIEYGTNLHIGVLFFENFSNSMCALAHSHKIHYSTLCEKFKNDGKDAYKRCFACRNLAIKKAVTSKKAFGGICINGIYEYTHPVVIGDMVVCVIFVGNILCEEGLQKIKRRIGDRQFPTDTLEKNFSEDKCKSICKTLENYIIFLLEKYPDEDENKNENENQRGSDNSLITDIKNYIRCNLEFDINILSVAHVFHYNHRYLGRLFKKETGIHMYEYINLQRINLAKELLSTTDLKIIDISIKVGFNSVTYFNLLFKREVGVTPTEFRKVSKSGR